MSNSDLLCSGRMGVMKESNPPPGTKVLEGLPHVPFYLSDITSPMIESFKLHRLKRVKNKTVNNDLAVIRRFLSLAVSRGYLHRTPMGNVELLRLSDRKLPRFLSKNELPRIYAEMSQEDSSILKILANTGIRWGELRYLEWQDIDLEQRIMSVRPKENWSPKGGVERRIPMNDVVYEILSGVLLA